MKTKLKAWPNGMGYDFGNWQLMKRYDGVWFASYTPNGQFYATKAGEGDTYVAAIQNAKNIER